MQEKIELSEEELYKITSRIALSRYLKSDKYSEKYECCDLINDVMLHFYVYGIDKILEKTRPHIENIIYMQCKNCIIDKLKRRRAEVISLSYPMNTDMLPVIEGKYYELDLLDLFNRIDNDVFSDLKIHYKGSIYKLTHRNMMGLYIILDKGVRLKSKDFTNIIFNDTIPATDSEIKGVIKKFQNYIKKFKILEDTDII